MKTNKFLGISMTIKIFSLESINNVGDELLGITTEYLVKKSAQAKSVERLQLTPSYRMLAKEEPWALLAMPLHWLYLRLNPRSRTSFLLGKIIFFIRLRHYYAVHLKGTDKVIFPVGMLKFANQNFSYIFSLVNRMATMRNIKVLMSAMSVAKPDKSDPRYIDLVEAVNEPCVWGITTRDGSEGLARLRKYYSRGMQFTDFVGDPALWTAEALGISKKKSDIIGINIIRPTIYHSYKEGDFSPEQMTQLYKEIVEELDRRGYDWVFYDNGMNEDHNYGLQLIKEFKLPESKLMAQPRNAKEYVEMVAGFYAVFGARLHACITAVSLGIPVAGLLWDNKLDFFSRTMGIRPFFSEVNELKGTLIVNKLEAAIRHDFDKENMRLYKLKTLDSITTFINS